MWKLSRIIAEDLCAFRELDYQPQQGVTTLIFGNNLDNESQKSNGSGKSALLECIAVGITGSPLRKIKNEEIINDKSDECYVCLQFINDSSHEMFTIERRLSRKASATVSCFIERDGKLVETDEAVQATIDGYNKYILDKLGLSKEELYNNFLLSKFKFQDFLSSSDREKKEIINRFSNGILVDGAIEKLSVDKLPVQEELRKAELEMAGIDGRIEMLTEQITAEENNQAEKAHTKEEKIASMQQAVSGKRALIRQKEEEIIAVNELLSELESTDQEIQALENEDHPLEYYLSKIRAMLSPLSIELSDWEKIIEGKHIERKSLEAELAKWDESLLAVEKKVGELVAVYDHLKTEHQTFANVYATKAESYDITLERMQEQLNQIGRDAGQLKANRRVLSGIIEDLGNRLAGTITCPKCAHKFLVSDKAFDVAQGVKELEEKKVELKVLTFRIEECEGRTIDIDKSREKVRTSKRLLVSENNDWDDKLAGAARRIRIVSDEQEGVCVAHKKVKDSIFSLWEALGSMCKRVFDESFDLIDDACREKERKVKLLQEEKAAARSSVETLEEAIRELNATSTSDLIGSLKASLKTYRKNSSEAVSHKSVIEKQMQRLEEQEQRFVQFKTYLANTKIEALNKVTNEFLENISSDIRIRFSGYTVLKTGKVREKISVSLVRDGIDQGNFGKFSAGEAARVNLATILAMQKLINSNCELDKGMDLLVLDEILEAVDEEGLSSMFAALNTLGITALVVSHGNVAESYPYKLIITKEHGCSTITEGML